MIDDEYKDPTQTMPEPPPESCQRKSSCMSRLYTLQVNQKLEIKIQIHSR
jgi:hypothetical protein